MLVFSRLHKRKYLPLLDLEWAGWCTRAVWRSTTTHLVSGLSYNAFQWGSSNRSSHVVVLNVTLQEAVSNGRPAGCWDLEWAGRCTPAVWRIACVRLSPGSRYNALQWDEIVMHWVRDAIRHTAVGCLPGQLVDGRHDGRGLQWENPRW